VSGLFVEDLVVTILNILLFAIVARAILSFVLPISGDRPPQILLNINAIIYQVTEPILGPIRRFISRILPDIGALDFSPMAAILILIFIKGVVIPKLFNAG
jgi:YggT family protein